MTTRGVPPICSLPHVIDETEEIAAFQSQALRLVSAWRLSGMPLGKLTIQVASVESLPSPRAALLDQLWGAVRGALAAGEHEVARAMHEAIGRLLSSPSAPGEGAHVVDIAVGCGKRGDR